MKRGSTRLSACNTVAARSLIARVSPAGVVGSGPLAAPGVAAVDRANVNVVVCLRHLISGDRFPARWSVATSFHDRSLRYWVLDAAQLLRC